MAAKHNTDRLRAKRAASRRADPRLEVDSVELAAENPVEGPRSDVLSALAMNEAVRAQADEREAAAHPDATTIEHSADSGGAAVAQTSLGEFGRGLFGGSDVVQLAQAGGGAVADTSASAPAAAGGFSPGLGTLFGLLGAAGLAGSGSGGGGLAGGASAGAAPKPLVTASIEVINGYVAGAKVWQDTNNNGKIDAGEPIGWWDKNGNGTLDAGEQETSAEGRITLQLDPQGGPVRTLGGTDLSTGKPVTNSFAAPARGTVISPITTVIQAAIASGESLTDAVNTVKRAFGLDAGADLLTLDPVESSLGTGAASDQAIKVKAAAVQISNAMDLGASLLAGAGSGADNSALVAASLAKAIMSGGGASVNLASANTLSSVLTDAVGASGLSGTARDKAQGALATTAFLAANANAIVAEAVNAPDHKEALTVIGRAQRVAQVEASEALSAAIQSGGAMATLASGFSGAAFATKASQITDGVIAPGVSMVSVDVLPTTVAAPAGSGITVEALPLRASITPIGSTALAGLTAGGSGKFSASFSSAPTAFDASKIEVGSGLTLGGIEKLTNTRYVVTVNASAGQIGERIVKLAAGWAGQGSTGDEVTVKVNPPFAGMQFSETSARVLGFEGASADIVKLSDGNSVMRFTKPLSAKPYAGATLALNVADALGTLDVSAADSKLGMWVYAPQANLPIRLQLASSDAGLVPRYTQAGQPLISDDRKFVETETRTVKAGWQWMEFDFGKPVDRWVGVYETAIKVALDPAVRYDKVSVFPDFNATPTGATFYFDGLTRGGTAPGVPVEPPGKFSSLDFQGAAASYRQLGFGGASGSLVADPENADNTVVKVVKSANAETWAGVTLASLPGDASAVPSIPFSAGTVMTAAVYSPAAGTKVRMKVENSADPTVSVETESVTKFAGWETVRFDFANPVSGTAPLDAAKTYDKLNVFFDFGVAGSNGRSYYIDDIRFLGAAARAPGNPIPAGYSLVFEDAFDVAGKTAPNPAVWKYDLGDGSKKGIPGWGNGEQQYYTADPDNVWVENGSLHIVAKANDTATNTSDRLVNGAVVPFTSGITSARLTTEGWNVSPYGYVEVRAKLPAEQGAWPAIWMLGAQNNWPKSGEIDIVEWSGRYFNDSTAQAALHFEKDFGNTQTKASTSLASSVGRFHTYQLWWSPTEIRIGVDGDAESAYFRYSKQSDFDVSRWPFDSPFYLLMNVAVGGTLGGDGFAQALAKAPYEMLVDYVRVYQGASSGGGSGSSNALLVSFETTDTSGYAVGTGADFGGAVSSVVSDGPTGSNGRVAKVVKGQGAETWAGTTLLALSGKEVISAGNETVTMKVYAPAAGIPVMLKVENGANSSQFIEKTVNTTQAGAWETLSFSFAGANHTPDYTKASVFFDFGTGGTGKTFYLDDVSLGGATPNVPYTAPSNLKVSFETSDTSGYTLGTGADFGGAASSLVSDGPAGSSGKVAKVVKGQGAETWAGTTFLALSGKEVIASGAETVTVRVHSPQAGAAVLLKLENGANGSQFAEKQMTTTKTGEWETLSFNFAGANHAIDYTKAAMFFDFGVAGAGKTFYFDDVGYTGGTLTAAPTVTQLAAVASFETTDTSGYAVGTGADFGGAASSVVSDGPAGSNGRVAKVVKGQGAETWAGTTLLALSGKEVISAGNETVTMKVYAPAAGIPVMLKVENGANSSQFIEKTVNTTQAGAWETLSFSFAGANHTPDYTKASVFFDFGTGGTGKTFYLDDVSLGGAAPSAAPSARIVDFDAGDSDYQLGGSSDFGNAVSSRAADPVVSANSAAKVVKATGAETWAGTTFMKVPGFDIISPTSETVGMKVWAPAAGVPVRLKLESIADNTKTVETQTNTTAAGWQDLIFNFANPVAGTAPLDHSKTFDMASVFFDFGSTGSNKTFYFDDVSFRVLPV